MAGSLTTKFSAALLMLGLCACGGGGGGGGVQPNPPPPPAPPPSPPPPPAAYATFPAAEDGTEYDVLAFGMGGDITTTTTNGITRVSGLQPRDIAVGPGTNDYGITQVAPGVYSVDIHGFGGPTLQMGGDDPRFDHGSQGDANFLEILELAKADVAIDLTYSSFGNFTWVQSDGVGYVSFLAIGQRTRPEDMPVSGTASYTGVVDGLWHDGSELRRLYGSTASLGVDFATGSVTSTLNLVGRLDPFGNYAAAPATELGTFQGTGSLNDFQFFTGTYGSVAGYSGSFEGIFFGPTAVEYGLTFGLSGPNGASVAGASVGRRD